MKQLIIGLVVGAAVALPATAYAHDTTPHAKLIYHAGDQEVYVFDDQDNKCYVSNSTWHGAHAAISCVKR